VLVAKQQQQQQQQQLEFVLHCMNRSCCGAFLRLLGVVRSVGLTQQLLTHGRGPGLGTAGHTSTTPPSPPWCSWVRYQEVPLFVSGVCAPLPCPLPHLTSPPNTQDPPHPNSPHPAPPSPSPYTRSVRARRVVLCHQRFFLLQFTNHLSPPPPPPPLPPTSRCSHLQAVVPR